MSSILEVQNLAKNYGDFAAIKGISFDIKEGGIFSLLGPNGAGNPKIPSLAEAIHQVLTPDEIETFVITCAHS